MRKLFLAVTCATLLVFAFSGSGSATLIGDTVYLEHNNGSIVANTSAMVVATDVTFNPAYKLGYAVDVLADSIIIDFTSGKKFNAMPFNGLILTGLNDSSGSLLQGVTSSYGNTTFGDDWVAFNFAGTSFALGDSITATLSFVAAPGGVDIGGDTGGNTMHNPIPAPILLLGTGLVGLAGFRRRIKK